MSLNYNWRLGGKRSENMVEANPQRLTSQNGRRWALGRNVKGETAEAGVYQPVEVWTLKERVNGVATTVHTGRSREEAQAWVA